MATPRRFSVDIGRRNLGYIVAVGVVIIPIEFLYSSSFVPFDEVPQKEARDDYFGSEVGVSATRGVSSDVIGLRGSEEEYYLNGMKRRILNLDFTIPNRRSITQRALACRRLKSSSMDRGR